jgi:hypothetical protein
MFSPSNFTSIDQLEKVHVPVIWCVTTPIPSDFVAASSPEVFLKTDESFRRTSLPPIFTVLLPSLVSEARPVFGYGTGIGPAGGDGGLRQTSGNAAADLPSAALQVMERLLAKTVSLINTLS